MNIEKLKELVAKATQPADCLSLYAEVAQATIAIEQAMTPAFVAKLLRLWDASNIVTAHCNSDSTDIEEYAARDKALWEEFDAALNELEAETD